MQTITQNNYDDDFLLRKSSALDILHPAFKADVLLLQDIVL